MEFLRTQGIAVYKMPTFTYIERYSDFSNRILAQVPQQLGQIRAINEENLRRRSLEHLPRWYESKGVSLSEEALHQYVDVTIQRLRKVSALSDDAISKLNSYGTEMLFFKSLEKVLDYNPQNKAEMILDSCVAHELWHVIEMRQDLLNGMIIEGTAEYARTEFEKWRQQKLSEKIACQIPNLSDDESGKNVLINMVGENIYRKSFDIVRNMVTSLSQVLLPETRARMEAGFLEYLDQWTAARVDKNDTPNSQRAAMNRMFWPEFNLLDQGLTQDNFLAALKSTGLTKMAAELHNQDCSNLLAEYEQMGYCSK